MTEFTFHTEESAPEASKPLLAEKRKQYGMIGGLPAVMAEAPGLLEAYKTVHELFVNFSFNNDELTVVQKVMSNYTNHIAKTPVDTPFRAYTWSRIDSNAA